MKTTRGCLINHWLERGVLFSDGVNYSLLKRPYEPSVIRTPQGTQTWKQQRWWTHGECDNVLVWVGWSGGVRWLKKKTNSWDVWKAYKNLIEIKQWRISVLHIISEICFLYWLHFLIAAACMAYHKTSLSFLPHKYKNFSIKRWKGYKIMSRSTKLHCSKVSRWWCPWRGLLLHTKPVVGLFACFSKDTFATTLK